MNLRKYPNYDLLSIRMIRSLFPCSFYDTTYLHIFAWISVLGRTSGSGDETSRQFRQFWRWYLTVCFHGDLHQKSVCLWSHIWAVLSLTKTRICYFVFVTADHKPLLRCFSLLQVSFTDHTLHVFLLYFSKRLIFVPEHHEQGNVFFPAHGRSPFKQIHWVPFGIFLRGLGIRPFAWSWIIL